jgi:hypothetical protein
MKRLASRTLSAAAIGVTVVGLAAGVSASAAPARAQAKPAEACHIDWFTHPWAPGQFGASLSIDTNRAFPNWLLTFGFTGSERVEDVPAGPVDWWYQLGRVVAIKGDSQLRNLPVGQDVLQLPLTITGQPAGTPWFALNGRPCSVTATTAITPTTTTTTTSTTTTSTTTTTTPSYPNDSCQARYQIIWQTATQFSARVSWSGTPTLYSSDQLRVVFSGDQQVTDLTPEQGPDATWTQTGKELLVSGYPWAGGHAASFRGTYSGVNGPPVFVGAVSGCTLTFIPVQSTTTTFASGG